MDKFIQLHVLTSYPPSNLNRDMLGRPKTAMVGNTMRLRISSQSLKRAWRTGVVFNNILKESVGIRTRNLGAHLSKYLVDKGYSQKKASEAVKKVAEIFGKVDIKGDDVEGKQLFFFTRGELDMAEEAALGIAEGNLEKFDELKGFGGKSTASDVALFGRMLAEKEADGKWNVEAACQVAHAISVQKIGIEEDDFTAVDDLSGDTGAGHMGVTEYGSGLFYLYVCIDRDLLKRNLGPHSELLEPTIAALVESILTVSPTGKQNSFASRSWASFCLAEKGTRQPRSLSVSFLTSLNQEVNLLEVATEKLLSTRESMDKSYWGTSESSYSFIPFRGDGSLDELIKFTQA